MTAHFDELTLLRFAVDEAASGERPAVAMHLEDCAQCAQVLDGLKALDLELRRPGSRAVLADEPGDTELSADDPFQRRPRPSRFPASKPGSRAALNALAVPASEAAWAAHEPLVEAARRPGAIEAALAGSSLADPVTRLSWIYALQATGRQIARDPLAANAFAKAVLRRLRTGRHSDGGSGADAERVVPLVFLAGQAHVLAAQACTWTRQFSRARSHLRVAYRLFAGAGGDETSLAVVELAESQRRALAGDEAPSLPLARRARATFEALGLDDLAARAWVAEGLANTAANRLADAARAYRRALPVFERYELWSNYLGALNSLATALYKLGRLDEARREFARAFHLLSRSRDRSFLGFLRQGLGDILFAAGRFRESALAHARAAQLYRESGLKAPALSAALAEAESWARNGNVDRALARLELVGDEIRRDSSLDPAVARQLTAALATAQGNAHAIAELRERVQVLLAGPFGGRIS